MRKRLFPLLLFALTAQAQKLSPWLAQQVDNATSAARAATVSAANSNPSATIDVLVKFADNADAAATLADYDADVLNAIGRVHIVRLPLAQVTALAGDDRVLRVEAERAPRPMLDRVPQQIGADKAASTADKQLPQAFTGKDVVVGIVDEGFDYLHPMFRDAKGTTRIGWAADYLVDKQYTTAAAVTAAQHSSDATTQLHGTHVAGIAAGSRVNDVNDVFYRGIALDADIAEGAVDMVIRTDGTGLSSVSSLRAFADIFAWADEQQKPCVINFSAGDAMSFANNRQLENEAIHTLLEKPGHALVVAAGNAGSTARLAHKENTDDEAAVGVMFNDDEQFGTYFGLELKVLPTQTITLKHTNSTYRTVKAELTSTAQDMAEAKSLRLGTHQLTIAHRGTTDGGYMVIYVTAGDTTFPTSDRVLVGISGEGDAWVYADPLCAQLETVSADLSASVHRVMPYDGYSMTWPAELDDVIAVGSIAHRMKVFTAANKYARSDSTDLTPYESTKGPGYIARSSSVGPTLKEFQAKAGTGAASTKPDVCAPGVNVISALNNFIDENTEMDYAGWLITHMDTEYEEGYGYSMVLAQTGTSMASPAVAGTIALWLQADPTLTTAQIKDIIAHSSRQPDATLSYPNDTYGHGEVDAYRGLLYMLNLTAISDLSLSQPAAARFRLDGSRLTIAGVGEDHHFTVRIYSTDGRLVHIAQDQATIDVGHLPAGVYAVQLNTGSAQTTGSTLIRL